MRANFGTQPFKYTPCETPNEGTPAVSPAASEERLSEILPIGAFSETESESESVGGGVTSSRAGSAAKIPVHDAPQQLPMPGKFDIRIILSVLFAYSFVYSFQKRWKYLYSFT